MDPKGSTKSENDSGGIRTSLILLHYHEGGIERASRLFLTVFPFLWAACSIFFRRCCRCFRSRWKYLQRELRREVDAAREEEKVSLDLCRVLRCLMLSDHALLCRSRAR